MFVERGSLPFLRDRFSFSSRDGQEMKPRHARQFSNVIRSSLVENIRKLLLYGGYISE